MLSGKIVQVYELFVNEFGILRDGTVEELQGFVGLAEGYGVG